MSEVMLQQTQAARVVPAFERFMARFPSLADLAAATRGEVLRAWAGLGYNRRAVALHEAARTVVRDHGGRIPEDREDLLALPGVGPYTSAALASIAFGRPVAAVDTNVGRVVGRVVLGTDAGDGRAVGEAAGAWLDRADPGGWNQALMDLGREVCRPAPRCPDCPVARWCRFRLTAAREGWRRRPLSARGRPPERRGTWLVPFPGSSREVRGRVVQALREHPALTLRTLTRVAGAPLERVVAAVTALHAEGLVRAGPAALTGRPAGRVRLPA